MSSGPCTPSLLDLLNDPLAVSKVPSQSIPTLICQLSAIQTALAARLMQPVEQEPSQGQPGLVQLLTLPEIAPLLGVPAAYVYELARRGSTSHRAVR